jgi:hypothetical protein
MALFKSDKLRVTLLYAVCLQGSVGVPESYSIVMPTVALLVIAKWLVTLLCLNSVC